MKETKIKQEKIRKVFLEGLPRKEYKGRYFIDWERCIGVTIKFIYEDVEDYLKIIDYIKNINDKKHPRVRIKYKDKECDITTTSFINCGLGNILNKRTNDFKIEINTHFKDDKRDMVITNRAYIEDNNGRKWKSYKYICNKCGFDCGEHYFPTNKEYKEELWIEESRLLNGQVCQCCCEQSKIVVEKINSIVTTAPWMIPYFQGGYEEAKLYTYGCSNKIYPICPDCRQIKRKEMIILDIYKTHSIGCSCSDNQSYPNKFAFKLLEQLDIDFKTEYAPNWIKPRRYDFYFKLNNKKYILEMDGGFHSKYNKMNGQTVIESKDIDNYKDKMAESHGIEVIRIDCELSNLEYIRNNLLIDTTLNQLFDLSKINWFKVEEFALSNLVKVACKYKNNNTDLATEDIGKIMKINRATVREYLKKGSKLGWCHYDTKEEKIRSSLEGGIRLKILKSKQIEIFKSGQSLGVFSSVSDLSNKSYKLFGIDLSINGIARVARGERTHHKGYTFKYVA